MSYTPLTKMTDSVDIISSLGNRPNSDDGLNATALKAKFDEAANDIKDYINGKTVNNAHVDGLVDELDGKLAALEEAVDSLVAYTVPDNSITGPKIVNLEVSHAKLSFNSVTRDNVMDGEIVYGKIGQEAVDGPNIKPGAVDTTQLALGAVGHDQLGVDAVRANNVKNGEINNDKLAPNTIDYTKTNGTIQKRRVADVGTLPSISSANGTQTVNVSGVTVSNVVLISPTASSWQKWRDCGVRCTAQASGTLTFTAESATGESLSFNYVILD